MWELPDETRSVGRKPKQKGGMVLSTGGSPVPTPADSEEASFPHYIIGRLQRHVVLLAFCIRVMASGRIIKGWSRL